MMKCTNCGFDNPTGMKYCGMCAMALIPVCPNCGYANPSGHRFCGMCGAKLTVQEREDIYEEVQVFKPAHDITIAPLDGERRVATIIIADVKDSTQLLERLGTEPWVELMNQVFQLLETEIYRFGGVVDQFRGDGLVAFFGAQTAHEDDPERAVLAALMMQRVIKQYALKLLDHDGLSLALRVGVNTGEIIVTSVGDDRRHSEDTAMGEAVALAARMESAAEPGSVLVSENTYRLTASYFEWQSLGEIMVKGRSQPVAVYRPLLFRADDERLAGVQPYRFSLPLIGLKSEFDLLREHVEALRQGQGGIITLTGERGMGKSFLLGKVRQYFTRQNALLTEVRVNRPRATSTSCCTAITWLHHQCRSYNQTWPYALWFRLLRQWLKVSFDDPPEEIAHRFRVQAQALWGDQWQEYYPYLAHFLMLPMSSVDAARIADLEAGPMRERFFLSIRSWIQALARQGSLVLSISNAQWVNQTSLDLLEFCLPLCEQVPLLWIIVFRPDETSPIWGFRGRIREFGAPYITELELKPMNTVQSAEFVEALIGPDVLPAETQSRLIEKAQGNPYYIEEMVHALVDRGVLVHDVKTGRWQATQAVTAFALPDSLHSLLMARMDQLSATTRYVLQMASVIGPIFWFDMLLALLSGMPSSQLEEHLQLLREAQLIHDRRHVPLLGYEYAFESSLVRDVVYGNLLTAQRVAAHLKVAHYLECLVATGKKEYYGFLAAQYRAAGELDHALDYTLKAASQANQFYADTEVQQHYLRALELLKAMAPDEAAALPQDSEDFPSPQLPG
ncbi:MAG: AAA family ATPase [Anaerolineae bacterium]|nr:AAA family ATPase [Anaerolineae bacterium]